jgi:hypothetical protein
MGSRFGDFPVASFKTSLRGDIVLQSQLVLIGGHGGQEASR